GRHPIGRLAKRGIFAQGALGGTHTKYDVINDQRLQERRHEGADAWRGRARYVLALRIRKVKAREPSQPSFAVRLQAQLLGPGLPVVALLPEGPQVVEQRFRR